MDVARVFHQLRRTHYLPLVTSPGQYCALLQLREQPPSGERTLSSLRHQCMSRPLKCLLIFAIFVLALAVDSARSPQKQFTAKTYLLAVDGYQRYLHPVTHRFIRCRYTPTCSHYSQEAVRRYGIRRGLVLTLRRLASCKGSVPMGTLDPVPS